MARPSAIRLFNSIRWSVFDLRGLAPDDDCWISCPDNEFCGGV